jgi:hypothetical protein
MKIELYIKTIYKKRAIELIQNLLFVDVCEMKYDIEMANVYFN